MIGTRERTVIAATCNLAVAALLSMPLACASTGATWNTPGLHAPDRIGHVIDSVVTSPQLAATSWGIAVRDARTRTWIAALNAEKHFIPASNTKIVVTAVAMGVLGPEYRWETPVFARMHAGDSTAGELVVIGRGDPTFSRRFHAGDLTVTDSIADRIAAAGIRRVTGDIIVDVSFFGDRPVNGTWEVGDLPWSYAPPIEAFAIGEATFEIVVHGGSGAGDDARVMVTGGPPGLQPIDARVTTDTAGAPARIDIDYLDRVDRVIVRGSIGEGATDTSRIAVTHPARYAGRALEHALRTRGIRIDGDVRALDDSTEAGRLRERLNAGYQRIATMSSPPLVDVVAAIMRPSQNWIAEQLLKTLGAERRSSGGWSTGLDVERRYLIDVARIDSSGFFLRDASGLSPQNLLAPATIVALLEHARAEPWGDRYRETMPEPGMEESTLENRLPELAGRLRAKTGSITNVNTLSGYVTTRDGRTLIFSIMTNGSGVSAAAVRRGMDSIILAIAGEGARQ